MDYTDLRKLLERLPDLAERDGESSALREVETHLACVAELRRSLSESDDLDEMDSFRRALLPLLLQSEFGYHCFTKPRGYPGDFVTQEMIWLGRTAGNSHRYLGNSPLGRLLTALTFDMAAPAANESRIHRLRRHLAENHRRVASVGCGSCIELWDRAVSAHSSLLLLDQDAGALQSAGEHLEGRGTDVKLHQENVLKCILRNSAQRHLGQQDFLYAFGLLDYFPTATARRIVIALWEAVAPGGQLLVTNAHPDNPTRVWMEYVGDWFLKYKTADELLGLSEHLPGVARRDLTLDEFGVYQYLELHKE